MPSCLSLLSLHLRTVGPLFQGSTARLSGTEKLFTSGQSGPSSKEAPHGCQAPKSEREYPSPHSPHLLPVLHLFQGSTARQSSTEGSSTRPTPCNISFAKAVAQAGTHIFFPRKVDLSKDQSTSTRYNGPQCKGFASYSSCHSQGFQWSPLKVRGLFLGVPRAIGFPPSIRVTEPPISPTGWFLTSCVFLPLFRRIGSAARRHSGSEGQPPTKRPMKHKKSEQSPERVRRISSAITE